jgi:HK97 family phage major capsid protein
MTEAFRQFRVNEGSAFLAGTGSDQPKGLTTDATSAVADGSGVSPERPFGTFQHIASGSAADLGGDMLTSPQGDIVQTLSNTVAALRVAYLPNAKWFMNPGTKAALIQKRDLQGRPLVESGMMGQPDRIQGYPIVVDEFMPAIGANALPIAFGDMRAAYTIVDHTAGMKVIVDEVTTKGKTGYYISRRVGGSPTDTNALKFIKCATS